MNLNLEGIIRCLLTCYQVLPLKKQYDLANELLLWVKLCACIQHKAISSLAWTSFSSNLLGRSYKPIIATNSVTMTKHLLAWHCTWSDHFSNLSLPSASYGTWISGYCCPLLLLTVHQGYDHYSDEPLLSSSASSEAGTWGRNSSWGYMWENNCHTQWIEPKVVRTWVVRHNLCLPL